MRFPSSFFTLVRDLQYRQYNQQNSNMNKDRVIAVVDGKSLHLVLGKTRREWLEAYAKDVVWDILLEELLDGTMEINEDIWYWLIDGRCFETTEEV